MTPPPFINFIKKTEEMVRDAFPKALDHSGFLEMYFSHIYGERKTEDKSTRFQSVSK